jgi:hypothetical protein
MRSCGLICHGKPGQWEPQVHKIAHFGAGSSSAPSLGSIVSDLNHRRGWRMKIDYYCCLQIAVFVAADVLVREQALEVVVVIISCGSLWLELSKRCWQLWLVVLVLLLLGTQELV